MSLRFCTLDPATLFNFLSLLPNVRDLDIAYSSPYPSSLDTVPDVPEVIPSFGGTLSLAGLNSGHLILKVVAALPLHFTTIIIRQCAFREPEAYQMLFTTCRDTLVILRFDEGYRGALEVSLGHPTCPYSPTNPDRPVPDVSLASCNRLEEVHALLSSNRKVARSIVNLLSSITSQVLRKISFSSIKFVNEWDSDSEDSDEDDWSNEEDGAETWNSLDTTLSHLAKEVSRAGGRLTLRFNIWRLDSAERAKFDCLLSQFLEYGTLDIS